MTVIFPLSSGSSDCYLTVRIWFVCCGIAELIVLYNNNMDPLGTHTQYSKFLVLRCSWVADAHKEYLSF